MVFRRRLLNKPAPSDKVSAAAETELEAQAKALWHKPQKKEAERLRKVIAAMRAQVTMQVSLPQRRLPFSVADRDLNAVRNFVLRKVKVQNPNALRIHGEVNEQDAVIKQLDNMDERLSKKIELSKKVLKEAGLITD